MDKNVEDSFDFGDPTLNDPDYESKVDAADQQQQQPPADDGANDDGAQTQSTPADGQREDGGQQPAPQQQNGDQQQKPDAGASSGSDKGAPPQDGKQGQPSANKVDAKGNIVDDKGNIIAAAGVERRQYERAQRQQSYISQLETQLTEERNKRADIVALNGAPEKLGLDARETELGLQAIASFKKDPVATARWMLQETMRLGYSVKDIIGTDAAGQGGSGSLDLQAIKSMINDAVGPMLQDRTAQQRELEAREQAQREYDAFVSKHEYADTHEDVLANMLADNRSLTPEVAYWQLREYAAKNGLDFTKPLRAQVEARERAQERPGNAAPQAQTQQPQMAPMPNGSSPSQDMRTGPQMASPDDTWDQILQQSLAEAGFTR
jgi:hypothetical protein